MLVPKLKEQAKLPELFLDVLPSTCICGFPFEITTSLNELRCSNPRCPNKIKYRMKKLMEYIGVTICTDADINAFVDKYNAQDPYLIFGYSFKNDGLFGNSTEEHCKQIEETLKKRNTFTLGDYLLYAGMPKLDSSIRVLGHKYNTIEELYNNLSIEQLSIDLGYENDSNILNDRVIQVYKTLLSYKTDLIQNSHLVNIVPKDDIEIIKITCDATNLSSFSSLNDYIATLNNAKTGKYIICSSIIYPDTQYYVCNSNENKFNVDRAKKLNIPSMTLLEFQTKLSNL